MTGFSTLQIKLVQVQNSFEWGSMYIGMGCTMRKSWKQGNPLGNTIKDTGTIMHNPLPELCREVLRMIVLVSLIVLLREFPCFHDFAWCIPSLHPHSFNEIIFELVPHIFDAARYVHTRTCTSTIMCIPLPEYVERGYA